MANAATLDSDLTGAPKPRGLTAVTDQAMYVKGDWNASRQVPSALIADSLNVLSDAWDDSTDFLDVNRRPASDTTILAAVAAGTDSSGGAQGPHGQDAGDFNGGVTNFLRLHESWRGKSLTHAGSFVSLHSPRHVSGVIDHGHPQFRAPLRTWGFDPALRDAAQQPPLSPKLPFVAMGSKCRCISETGR